MGIIQKQSISGVIWSYAGVALGFVTTVVLFTRWLDTEEIGLLRLLVSYSSIMAMFASLGMNSVAVKMFPKFRDEKTGHHGFLALAVIVVLAGFAVSTLVYLLMQDYFIVNAEKKSSLFIPYFFTVIPLTLFLVLYGILDSYFRVLFNAVKGLAYKEVHQRVFIILAIVLYYFEFIDFTTFVWSYVFAYLLPVVLLIISLIRQKMLVFKTDFGFLDKPLKREIMSVAVFGILASFSSILVQSIDVIMINEMLGLGPTGVYTISFFFGTLILIPMRTMSRIGGVVVSEAWKKNDLKTISEVYTKSSLTLSILGLLFFIGIWGNIENVFQLVGQQYSEGRYVILFIALANLTDVYTGMSNQIIANSKYYRWLTYLLLVFTGLIVITNFLLIPAYGIVGAALASFISKLAYNIMQYAFLYHRFGLQPFNYKHLIAIVIAILAWWLSTLIPALSNYLLDIAVRSFALTAMFMLPVYFFKISDDLNGRVNSLLGVFKKIKNR